MEALSTDLYQLTMAAGYFHRGMAGDVATCEAFMRRLPRTRRYLVAMGIERLLDELPALRFTDDDVAYLREVPALRDAMTPAFVDYLRAFRFTGDVWAVPEGTPFFANEPIVRITAPVIEAQIVETWLLSVVNHAVAVASKAARIVRAAGDAAVVEFGTRRTHPAAAVDAARAAYAVGCAATSNVEAGRRFGIPVTGTAAHMWTMAHATEEDAFRAYVDVFPNASILLIDTYDTVRGAERAARIARDKLRGVRLDSGDLDALSRAVRAVLDANGCTGAKIVASGDLNEHIVARLRAAKAPIDVYGVGTELVVPPDGATLGGVYKLVEVTRGGVTTPIAKLSAGKATYPGAHQVHRARDASGRAIRDVVALASEPAPAIDGAARTEPLLEPAIVRGARARPPEPLDAIRARVRRELDALPDDLLRLDDGGAAYPVAPSLRLSALTESVRERLTEGSA